MSLLIPTFVCGYQPLCLNAITAIDKEQRCTQVSNFSLQNFWAERATFPPTSTSHQLRPIKLILYCF